MKQHYLFSVLVLVFVCSLYSCQKEIGSELPGTPGNNPPPSVPGPVTPADLSLNTWQFRDSNNSSIHYGIIDTIETKFDIKPIWNYLIIKGWPVSYGAVSNDTLFLIALFLPNPVIEPGIYNMTSGTGGEHIFGFGNNTIVPPYGSNQNFCYYLATPDIAPDFIIRIISYDRQQRLLKGSFSGTLRTRTSISDYNVRFHKISGSFYLRLN